MTKGLMQRIELRVVDKVYKICFLEGKYDFLEIHTRFGEETYKEKYPRGKNIGMVKEVLYLIGKHNSAAFKEICKMFKQYDPQFYEIISETLEKIKSEYNF